MDGRLDQRGVRLRRRGDQREGFKEREPAGLRPHLDSRAVPGHLPHNAAAWVTRFGPCPAPLETLEPLATGTGALAPADALARELREAVYQMIMATRGPGGAALCPAGPRARSMRSPRSRCPRPELPVPSPQMDQAGKLTWETSAPVQATVALIARDAIDLVTSEAITRVHDCANPGCRAMFPDSSRPGTWRWCSMNTCGTRPRRPPCGRGMLPGRERADHSGTHVPAGGNRSARASPGARPHSFDHRRQVRPSVPER